MIARYLILIFTIGRLLVFPIFFIISFVGGSQGHVNKDIQFYLDSIRATHDLPGITVSYSRGGSIPVSLSSGYAVLENKLEMPVNARMPAGSIGKTFFSVLTVMLVDKGQLSLDDRISKFIGSRPWFNQLPNANELTVRHLLNHSSGIEEYYLLGNFLADLKNNPYRYRSIEELITYALNRTPLFKAGSKFSYADTNYLVLQLVLEEILKEDPFNAIKRKIIEPLEFHNTFRASGPKLPNVTTGYIDPISIFGFSGPSIVNDKFIFDPRFEYAGGGFVSSTEDLRQWCRILYAGDTKLNFRPELLRQAILSEQLGIGTEYGLGLQVVPSPYGKGFGHGGWFPGYVSEMLYFPEIDTAIAIQVNTDDPLKLKYPLRKYITDVIRLAQN